MLEHDTLPLRRHRQFHDVSCSLGDAPAHSKISMHTQAPVHKATWYQQQFPHSAGGALLLLDANARMLPVSIREVSSCSRSSVLCLESAEMYMDLLCARESPKVVPASVALPKSMKRSRAHDDVVILTEKRARKGPGYYTHLADRAPSEQEMAGECFAQSFVRIFIL